MKKVLVYGSLEFGQVVRNLVKECGHEFVGYVDDSNSGDCVLGRFVDVMGQFPPGEYEVAVAVGYKSLEARWSVFEKVKSAGYRVPSLIHPRAYVHDAGKIAEGGIIMAGAIVDVNVTFAPLVVAWPGVVVNHDSNISANTFLSPNATVCGCVNVGSNCFVGAGVVVVDHVRVPNNSFIKAGSVFAR